MTLDYLGFIRSESARFAAVLADADAQWLVRIGHWSGHSPNSGKDYSDEPTLAVVEHGEPTFELSGAAGDLDAWLWNRPSSGPVELSGVAGPFEALIRRGVQ